LKPNGTKTYADIRLYPRKKFWKWFLVNKVTKHKKLIATATKTGKIFSAQTWICAEND